MTETAATPAAGGVLIHGYGLMDTTGETLTAGSRMSGLTLYNTLLMDGLGPRHRTAFLTGRIGPVADGVERRRDRAGRLVYEYDASFPQWLEPQGRFCPQLASLWYQDRVAEPGNPIYRHLTRVYRQVLAEFSPAVVNPHNLNAAVAYLRAVRRLAGPIPRAVVTVHDIDPRQLAFVARHQRWVKTFVATSRYVADTLCRGGIRPERVQRIPNGLVVKTFEADRAGLLARWRVIARREGLEPDSPCQVLVPARRVEGKGIGYALLGFDRFRARGGQGRLLLSGAGMACADHEQELRQLAASLPHGRDIHFLGPLSYTEMPAVFASSQVSLLPSTTQEGFAYVNLEAMLTGGPVVVTANHGGCLDYMEDGVNGLLVPPADQEAVAGALAAICHDPRRAERLKAAARRTAEDYTAAAMVRRYEAVLFPYGSRGVDDELPKAGSDPG